MFQKRQPLKKTRQFSMAAVLAGLLVCNSVGTVLAQDQQTAPTPTTAANGTPGDDTFAASLQSIFETSEAAAVGITIRHLNALNNQEIFKFKCISQSPCRSGLSYRFVPKFSIDAGENGSFQAINGKLAGEFILNSTDGVDADGDPIISPLRHVFPIAIGGETTRFADHFAVIGEVGYVPFHSNVGNFGGQLFQLGFNPFFGIFLQGGYKFDRTSKTLKGGSVDQSSEPGNDGILRIKSEFEITLELPEIPLIGEGFKPQAITWARAWYDIAHDDFYHSVGGILRFRLSEKSKTSVDFKFENGSGAPNFNKGTQFTTGLNWTF